ncbi:MAG: hypothetical protein DI565_09220 [Ancylobacter novellus]|uniref:Uncharacterized protein n=1 Tax=Ancylobacter novellus TaxID=921 RepID=A0A2W5MQT3_ANCNO|nr:MAG: hypothetical protein DI565_09220 [Ancylobacter novellus]
MAFLVRFTDLGCAIELRATTFADALGLVAFLRNANAAGVAVYRNDGDERYLETIGGSPVEQLARKRQDLENARQAGGDGPKG